MLYFMVWCHPKASCVQSPDFWKVMGLCGGTAGLLLGGEVLSEETDHDLKRYFSFPSSSVDALCFLSTMLWAALFHPSAVPSVLEPIIYGLRLEPLVGESFATSITSEHQTPTFPVFNMESHEELHRELSELQCQTPTAALNSLVLQLPGSWTVKLWDLLALQFSQSLCILPPSMP